MADNPTTVKLGMLPVNRGEYSSSNYYYKDNIVQYNGSSYIYSPANFDIDDPADSKTNEPPYNTYPDTLNTGWYKFATGNNTFTTHQQVENLGIDSVPTSGHTGYLITSDGVADAVASSTAKVGYYECATGGSTAAKVVSAVSAPDYVLSTGGSFKIKMTNKNTAASSVTLNINSTGAKTLYYDGELVTNDNTWDANEVVDVYYDGTSYYANNVSSGGKFLTGEKVKKVGIDSTPTAESENLVTSGGVYAPLHDLDKQITVDNFAKNEMTPISGLGIRNWNPAVITTIAGETLYYFPVTSGQLVYIEIEGSATRFNLAFSARKPANGVNVSDYKYAYAPMESFTAPNNGYVCISDAGVTNAVCYTNKTDIGSGVFNIQNELSGVLYNGFVIGNVLLFDRSKVSEGDTVVFKTDKTYSNGVVRFYGENDTILHEFAFSNSSTIEKVIPTGFDHCSTLYSPVYDSLIITQPSMREHIGKNAEEIKQMDAALSPIERMFSGNLYSGSAVDGNVLFTSDDIAVGEEINVVLDKTYVNGMLAFFNEEDTKLLEYAFSSVSSRTITIPSGFSYCKPIYSADWDSCVISCRPLKEIVISNTERIALLEAEHLDYPLLYGLKIAYNGDSICESRTDTSSSTYNGGAYAKLIADLVGGFYQNRGVSGGILASAAPDPSQTPTRTICTDVTNMADDADLICFEGGINDYWLHVPLGDYQPNKYDETDGAFDTTTLCGALESIFYQATSKWAGKPIVFIIVHKVGSTAYTKNYTGGYTFQEAHDKMVEICKKWSIPFYDAFSKSGLNGNIDVQNNEFFIKNVTTQIGDRTHPNIEGYKNYYVRQLISLFSSIIPTE